MLPPVAPQQILIAPTAANVGATADLTESGIVGNLLRAGQLSALG